MAMTTAQRLGNWSYKLYPLILLQNACPSNRRDNKNVLIVSIALSWSNAEETGRLYKPEFTFPFIHDLSSPDLLHISYEILSNC